MATTYTSDLLKISLTPEHWRTLHDLAVENRLTKGEMVSDWLGDTLQRIIDEHEFIEALQTPPDA